MKNGRERSENMISTIERENSIQGMLFGKMKELPNWYGIDDIGFVWHNEWSDPEIEYKGKRMNVNIIEDSMWQRWIYDDDGNFLKEKAYDQDGFAQFMKENVNEVYELIELTMESEE